MINLNKDTVEI